MAGDATTYRAFGPGLLVMGAFLFVVMGLATYDLVTKGDRIILFFLPIGAFIGFQLLRTPYAIIVEGEKCSFRGVARGTTVRASQIVSVRASRMLGNSITIRYHGGRVTMLGPFEGFHQFLTWLKAANPAVELRGV